MQEAQTVTENSGNCCGKKSGHRHQRRSGCGGSHKQEAGAAAASAVEILGQRFVRGEIDAAEFEEKRRLLASA
jgi:hypothetical protein